MQLSHSGPHTAEDDTLNYTILKTPIGPLLIAGDENGITEIRFPENGKAAKPEPEWIESADALADARAQLSEYFAGKRSSFDLTLNPSGTEFQRRVLDELKRIPYGQTASYSDIAERVGRPAAVRAVGAANGRNPIPIVIPCHRVIGKSGKLTGFAGGLDVKRRLLELESGTRSLFD